jgi:hypothetical protein
MAKWYNPTTWGQEPERMDEAIRAFEERPKPKLKDTLATRGEGWENVLDMPGIGRVGLQSFNMFYNTLINKQFENEVERIWEYRSMASQTEIADVVEDAVNEATQEDDDGKVFHLEIIDKELEKNENIVKNLRQEFYKLFIERLSMDDFVWGMFHNYMVDGRVFYERIIDSRHPKNGIIHVKRLPSETMDYIYDPLSSEIILYMQYLKPKPKKPATVEEARKRHGDDLIIFEPDQIGFVDYGIYGSSRYNIFGYLEKARVPFNQLKLLETSVIIYRIVRSPERFVFRIDTGNMPRDKALKYVEKIKQKMSKKQTYDPRSGTLTNEPEIMSILENFYLPQSAEGRGSQIESIGGFSPGFTELDDIYYFARKLYRSLKYPASRVQAAQESRTGDVLFGQGDTGTISRDEIKWSKFLERQQRKFCKDFTDMFLIHLEFKGLKKLYSLDEEKIKVVMNPPSRYKEQMDQSFLDSRFNNYSQLADREEMSKSYLMRKYLKWDDDEIKANVDGMKKDKLLGFRSDEEGGGGW